jgi:hypothetical protein
MTTATVTPDAFDTAIIAFNREFGRQNVSDAMSRAFYAKGRDSRSLHGEAYVTALLAEIREIAQEIKTANGQARRAEQALQIARAEGGTLAFITLCAAENCYGGSEEGGWYYTRLTPIAHIAVDAGISTARIHKIVAAMKAAQAPYAGDYAGHGCGGAGDDDGLYVGESFGDDAVTWELTIGAPYVWRGRPQYC